MLNNDKVAPSYVTAANYFKSRENIPRAKRGSNPMTTVQEPQVSSTMKASGNDQGQAGTFDQGGLLIVQGYASDMSVDHRNSAAGIVTAVEVTLDNGATWQRAVITAYTLLSSLPISDSDTNVSDPQAALWQVTYPINRLSGKHANLAAEYSIVTRDHHHWGQCSTVINISPSNHCEHLTNITIHTRAVDDSGWIEERSPAFTTTIPRCV